MNLRKPIYLFEIAFSDGNKSILSENNEKNAAIIAHAHRIMAGDEGVFPTSVTNLKTQEKVDVMPLGIIGT